MQSADKPTGKPANNSAGKPTGKPTDKVIIKNLMLRGIIGVNDWERKEKQDIIINITLYTDTRAVARTDSLEGGINYRSVCKSVGKLVESTSFYLVETLAEEIAKLCLREFPADAITVSVEKPNAVRFSVSVGVEITRSKSEYDEQ